MEFRLYGSTRALAHRECGSCRWNQCADWSCPSGGYLLRMLLIEEYSQGFPRLLLLNEQQRISSASVLQMSSRHAEILPQRSYSLEGVASFNAIEIFKCILRYFMLIIQFTNTIINIHNYTHQTLFLGGWKSLCPFHFSFIFLSAEAYVRNFISDLFIRLLN